MPDTRQNLLSDAIAWTIRLRHADAEDWEAFTAWLEADRAHLEAYEEVAAADAGLEALPTAAPRPVVHEEPAREARWGGRRMVLGWGIAAALVGVLGYSAMPGAESSYFVETAAGERRSIALKDGSSIHLNGNSRVQLDRDEPRFARLERGQALFEVVHHDSAPFKVEAGRTVIRDLGTVFDVVHEGDSVAVEVAEGAVSFEAGAEQVNLSAGMTARAARGEVTAGRLEAETIGGWRRGLLSYSSASLGDIALDLSRNTGITVRASPDVAERRFSGVIMLDADRPKLMRRVSALLEVDVRRSGEELLLVAADR